MKQLSLSITKICSLLTFIAIVFIGYGNKLSNIVLPLNISQMIMIVVFVILITTTRFIKIPRYFYVLILFLVLHTFTLGLKNHIIGSQLKSIIGIAIYALIFIVYFHKDKNNLLSFIRAYYKFAFIISLFAIAQVILFAFFNIKLFLPFFVHNSDSITLYRHEVFGILPRSFGVSSEPAHFAEILLPSIVAIFYSIVYKNNKIISINYKAVIILLAYLLTFSLNAYVGLLLILFMLTVKKIKLSRVIWVIPLLILLIWFSIKHIKPINDRVKSLITFNINDFGTADLSSYAIISNALVTVSALNESYFLGNGINSHPISYDKFIGKYINLSKIDIELNKKDAASTYLRILSELGIPGIILLYLFLKRFRINEGRNEISIYGIINDMALIYILISFIRSGKFISILLWLFIAAYFYSYQHNKQTSLT